MTGPKTVHQYLRGLPEDRRKALSAVREVIVENLPRGYEEGLSGGAISYHVPHSVYPPGYHCNPEQPLPFAGLASRKNHMALHLMSVYGNAELLAWFREAWASTGKKLDMGKSCIRFKRLEDVPLSVIGQVIKKVPAKKYIESYEAAIRRPSRPRKKAAAKRKNKAVVRKRAATAKTASARR